MSDGLAELDEIAATFDCVCGKFDVPCAKHAAERAATALRSRDAEIQRLREALGEAQAGLEFAVSRGCGCEGNFRCAPHLSLEAVRSARTTGDDNAE